LNRPIVVSCALALLGGAWAVPVSAQTPRDTGPYSGLFGAPPDETFSRALDIRGGVFGVYQDVRTPADPALPSPTDGSLQANGTFGGGAGAFSYNHRTDASHFLLNGGGSLYRFETTSNIDAAANANANLTKTMGTRFTLNLRGGAAYSPFYDELAPAELLIAPGDSLSMGGYGSAALTEPHLDLNSAVGFTGNISSYSTIEFGGRWSQMRFFDNGALDLRRWGARARYTHHLTRRFGFHLGYEHEDLRYGASSIVPAQNEMIDLGLDYGDTLTFARHTAVAFSASTSAIRYLGETHYRINGNATLTRAFGRTWSFAAGYIRETQFLPGFRSPMPSDGVTTWISGQVTPRVRWGTAAGYTRGTVGFGTGSDSFDALTGTSRLEVGLTRSMGIYGQYAYYRYQVPRGSAVFPILHQQSRQTVTAGLTFWAPAMRDRRPSQ
jgi:hypothetical protein